jgi:hypothetical protein
MSKEKENASSAQNTKLGEIFECNICFHEANEAVVTCCGHLFCWPCLYMWLYVHSSQRSCPVCIGIIEDRDITPIYGPTNFEKMSWIDEVVSRDKERKRLIPPRPQARRIQCGRQLCEREDTVQNQNEREDSHNAPPLVEGQIQQLNQYDQSTLELASHIPLPDQTNLEEILVIEPNEQILENSDMELHVENANGQNENNERNILAHLENLEDVFDIQHSTM